MAILAIAILLGTATLLLLAVIAACDRARSADELAEELDRGFLLFAPQRGRVQ